MEGFFRSLPKTETHLHLEGAVPLSVYRKYVDSLNPEDPPYWGQDFRYRSFDEFNEGLLQCALPFFNSLDRYREGARAVFLECWDQGVRYLEVSFHLGLVVGLPEVHPKEVIEAIRGEVPEGMEVRIYAGLLHNDYTGQVGEWIDEAPGWDNLDGFDLHGPEDLPFEEWTAGAWAAMREAGKRNRAHAGEFRGADFVAQVVRELKVERIAHGVRAIEDPATVDLLIAENVTLDVCPISNLKLAVNGIDSMPSHPIRRLFDAGVRVTVSSDDPTFFGNRLIDDYAALYYDCGFSVEEIGRIARNGFEVAHLEESRRQSLIRELEGVMKNFGGAAR
ncbi:adenosine deaminase family protein [Puniceicoccus vermicola]|uniref:Adenosine deaminase n=1 Tax=Puniceicoccus vermicola TaxID=388746 RepID=A0A7X1E3T0_9BACT|nr:adenosine deaminase [Puniceicoccus vermicola]MBC2601386.1 adenosine deaminase [Puniceicoccus vermicola]